MYKCLNANVFINTSSELAKNAIYSTAQVATEGAV